MPEDIATLEQTADSETTPSEPVEGDAEEETTEELDYRALWEESERAKKQLELDQRARNIQLLSEKKKQEMIAETHKMTKAVFDRFNKGEIDAGEAQEALGQDVANLLTAAAPQESTRVTMVEFEATIRKDLTDWGMATEGADGLLNVKDQRADNLIDFWHEGVKAYRAKEFAVAEAWRKAAVAERNRLATQVSADKAKPKSGLGLNDRTPRGTSGGTSEQALVNKLAKGEAMSPTEMARAGAAMDRGIYPKL